MVKQIFIDFQKFKHYSLLVKLSVKIKRSEFFAVHNDIQILGFWKLFTERTFCEKNAKVYHYTPSTSFPSFRSKVH